MAKKDKKSTKPKAKPKVHEQLQGFEISINQFGEIKSNLNIEKINEFLNENVDDKKLLDRNEEEVIKKTKKGTKK